MSSSQCENRLNYVLLSILVGVGVLAHVIVDMGGVLFSRLDGRQDGLELADLLRRKVVRRHRLCSGVEEVDVRRRLAYGPDKVAANDALEQLVNLGFLEGSGLKIGTVGSVGGTFWGFVGKDEVTKTCAVVGSAARSGKSCSICTRTARVA